MKKNIIFKITNQIKWNYKTVTKKSLQKQYFSGIIKKYNRAAHNNIQVNE